MPIFFKYSFTEKWIWNSPNPVLHTIPYLKIQRNLLTKSFFGHFVWFFDLNLLVNFTNTADFSRVSRYKFPFLRKFDFRLRKGKANLK